MALTAGFLQLTVEFGKDLKDKDWFGRQDPYVVMQVGTQYLRTKTHANGGRNPVWNETFTFNIVNENDVYFTIKDEDVGSKDDLIGTCRLSLAQVRTMGKDKQQIAVSSKSGKQHGILSVSLTFQPNTPQAMAAPYGAPQPGYAPAPYGYAPQPGYPPAPYPAAAPAPYPYPQQPYPQQPGYAPYPQQQYAPQPYPQAPQAPQAYPQQPYPYQPPRPHGY